MKIQKSKKTVRISHGQSFKQSKDWQSTDASYSVTIEVEDLPEAIERGFKRVERLVENALIKKSEQQRRFLNSLK